MVYDVIRTFGIDYIFFDLIFVTLFLFLLIKFKKKIPLLVFFIGGLGINFLMDWGIWLHTGIREISLPTNFFGEVFLFFLWFSLSYGIEYAYVFLMFEKKSNKIGWTVLVLIGWLSVAFLSQFLSINDSTIKVIRHMGDLRFLRIILVLIGYSLLFIFKYDWKKISYLFFVGFSIPILLENSLIEFNMGIPFFYLLYDKVLRKKFK